MTETRAITCPILELLAAAGHATAPLITAGESRYCPILHGAPPCCPRVWQGRAIRPPRVLRRPPQLSLL